MRRRWVGPGPPGTDRRSQREGRSSWCRPSRPEVVESSQRAVPLVAVPIVGFRHVENSRSNPLEVSGPLGEGQDGAELAGRATRIVVVENRNEIVPGAQFGIDEATRLGDLDRGFHERDRLAAPHVRQARGLVIQRLGHHPVELEALRQGEGEIRDFDGPSVRLVPHEGPRKRRQEFGLRLVRPDIRKLGQGGLQDLDGREVTMVRRPWRR